MAEPKKRILSNFISLSVVQGLSVVFPLLIFPMLLRVLGVEGFGVFTLVQTVIMYADLLVSFGFSLSATKAIARNIHDDAKTNDIILSTYLIKLVLFVVPLLLFMLLALFVPFLSGHFNYILISGLYVAGNLLFPDWYFQGIQKMGLITIVTFVSRCVSLLLVLVLVKSREDVGMALFALSVGNFLAGLTGFMILYRRFSLQMRMPSLRYVKAFFRDSAMVFSSIALVPLYSSLNLFILRYFTSPLAVGYYAIADKIYNAVSMLTSVANRTFYPHLASLNKTAVPAFRNQVRKITWLFFTGFSLLALVQFGFAGQIVTLVSGKKNTDDISTAIELLRIMSIATMLAPYGSFFFQLLIIQGRKRLAVRNIAAVVLINLLSATMLASYLGATGMAINLCLVVTCVGLFNFLSFHYHRS